MVEAPSNARYLRKEAVIRNFRTTERGDFDMRSGNSAIWQCYSAPEDTDELDEVIQFLASVNNSTFREADDGKTEALKNFYYNLKKIKHRENVVNNFGIGEEQT